MGTRSTGDGGPAAASVPEGLACRAGSGEGIDVALAVDFVRLACEGAYDVGILFSRDTDLVPALEAVRDLESGLAHVEVATWVGASRIRFPDSQLPWCHYLGADDYEACRDDTDYTVASPGEAPAGPARLRT